MSNNLATSVPNYHPLAAQAAMVGQWSGTVPYPAGRSTDELADYLLGLAVIIRIASGDNLMNVFSKDDTIQVLREVASRIRRLESEAQAAQWRGIWDTQNAKFYNNPEPIPYVDYSAKSAQQQVEWAKTLQDLQEGMNISKTVTATGLMDENNNL